MGNGKKQVIVADSSAVIRVGLKKLLVETDIFSFIDEACNRKELLSKLEFQHFDLVILDTSMPDADGLTVLKEIKSKWHSLAVVIFSLNPDAIFALRMINNGASAYINKETGLNKIIEILQIVISGKKYFTTNQTELIEERFFRNDNKIVPMHELLTDREFQVFCLLAGGTKKIEIAEKLGISKNTLSNHRNNILKKMNMNMNSELTRYAIQNGIIQ